jgi:hypothetical protein
MYKSQLTREELDANRIHQLELTWYRKSAELYNSDDKVIQSRLLDFEYGRPFDKKYRLVCPMKKADASDFRDMSTSLRHPFITISRNCKASGKGFEHYVKKYTKKVHKDDNGNIISNSDMVGYGYAAFEEEGVLELMIQAMPDQYQYAGSMKGVPELPLDGIDDNQNKRSSKKGGGRSTSKKRKDSVASSPSSGAVGAVGAVMRVLEYLKNATEKLGRKEKQLSRDKTVQFPWRSTIRDAWISHLFDLEMRFERQGKCLEEYKEHPYYKSALNNIEKAKARLQVHEEKVEELEKEIEELKAAETSEVSR